MLSTIRNCNNFFYSKPPTVIFLISLALLTIATFSFTYLIKNAISIENTDIKQNWDTLREHLNQYHLCPVNNTQIGAIERIEDETSTFVTLITINASHFRNFANNIHVEYNVDDVTSCDFTAPVTVYVNFILPSQPGIQDVCALVKGPKSLLPQYKQSVCEQDPHNNASNGKLLLQKLKNSVCTKQVRLLFKDYDGEFAIFLSDIDRNIIYSHLLLCGYFLVFFILVVLIYAMFCPVQQLKS